MVQAVSLPNFEVFVIFTNNVRYLILIVWLLMNNSYLTVFIVYINFRFPFFRFSVRRIEPVLNLSKVPKYFEEDFLKKISLFFVTLVWIQVSNDSALTLKCET